MATDAEVIDAVLRGEVDRYAELVERYQRAAWKLAYSVVGNMEDAKELSQNGFVKAYQHLRTFRREAKFSTWLYRIIMNECKDFCRRQARQPAMVSLGADPETDAAILFDVQDPAGHPSDHFDNVEWAREFSRAVLTLPIRQRTAFLLHHVHGLSLEEVSKVLGCRLGTVKSHLFRACAQLRVLLEPFVVTEAHA